MTEDHDSTDLGDVDELTLQVRANEEEHMRRLEEMLDYD